MSQKKARLALLAGLAFGLVSIASTAAAVCTAGPPLPGVPEQTPSAEFAVLTNGTALHMKTGLLWKRCAEGQTWDGADCTGVAEVMAWGSALTRSAVTSFANSNEWRVPNRKELESIVEFCGHSPTINQSVFPNTPHMRFWTSTTFQAETNRAWDVYFSDGYVGASTKTSLQHVRLVRSLTPGDYPLPQTVVFGPAPTVALGVSGTIAVAASSGLPVSLSVLTPGTCSLSGNSVTISSAGTCSIAGNQAGNATFAAAPQARLDIATGKIDQTISFGGVPVLVVGGSGTITATASSGLPVSLASSPPTICSLTGNTVRGLAVGTCTITANEAGNASYNAAPTATQHISVSAVGTVDQPSATVPVVVLTLFQGWNLIGNGTDTPFNVDDFFGESSKVESVWKWVRSGSIAGVKYPTWAFRTPTLADKGAALATLNAYEHLATIQPGEGFWVFANTRFDVTLPGTPLPAKTLAPPSTAQPGTLALGSGWSMVTTGEDLTPAQFYTTIGGKASGLISLWAWDPTLGKWMFYSPSLEAYSDKARNDYAAKRGWIALHGRGDQRLKPGTAIWVDLP